MPPPRITNAIEPRVNLPAVRKEVGGAGSAFTGIGLGSMGWFPGSVGFPVSPYAAMQIPTAWACVKRVAEDMGKLPRVVRRRLVRGYRAEAAHPINRLLRNPNRWQTPSQMWNYLTAWLMLRGNSYAVVTRGRGGEPNAIVPVSPNQCGVLLSPEGELFYQISHPFFGGGLRLHRDNVIHLRTAISYDGYTGVSPVAVAQDAFGLGIATQQHGATLFRQGTQLAGVITHPGKLDREGKDYLSESWNGRFAGVQNAHKTPVLDEGMKFEKLSMTAEDSQFLQSRQFTVPEICRMFGVPPHKAGDLSNAHFANVEQGEIAYRADTLLPIGNQMREELGRVLLFEDEQDLFEIDVDYDELQRTDRKTMAETNEIEIRSGTLTPNQARVIMGREPDVPNGDEYIRAMNMESTSAQAAEGTSAATVGVPPASLPSAPAAADSGEET
ncbi:phage portal protein [Roseomonas chloroacetimidivorans]|uniref:phage portal protein n=1 Tax=Roseomonas chloroacetimidivorans TaxID=1766656 RepID=UPI003C762130